MRKKEYVEIKKVMHNYQSLQELVVGEECNMGDFSPRQLDELMIYYE